MMEIAEKLVKMCPNEVDLTSDKQFARLLEIADFVLASRVDLAQIAELEKQLIAQNVDNSLVFALLVVKIVKSKMLVREIDQPLKVSVVFAVYKEHNRIKNSFQHPHGEDFLRKKVRQLEWLFASKDNIDWELTVVDDGCPEGSGQIAQSIVIEDNLSDRVRVLHLQEAIAQNLPAVAGISSVTDSQKGGAIVYGVLEAVERATQIAQNTKHIVAYTDADLSTNLAQLGLLLEPILSQGKLAAIGSRREADSVVVKKGARNNRGKLFIYLWKRLIPGLNDIVDTQCGFKAFDAQIVPEIMDNLIEKKFAFDIELLIRTELLRKNAIAKVSIALVDSPEASTTTDLQPYLPMLKSIVKMRKKYFPNADQSNEFIAFIENLTQTEFAQLLENIPEEITKRNPNEFAQFDQVRVGDL